MESLKKEIEQVKKDTISKLEGNESYIKQEARSKDDADVNQLAAFGKGVKV